MMNARAALSHDLTRGLFIGTLAISYALFASDYVRTFIGLGNIGVRSSYFVFCVFSFLVAMFLDSHRVTKSMALNWPLFAIAGALLLSSLVHWPLGADGWERIEAVLAPMLLAQVLLVLASGTGNWVDLLIGFILASAVLSGAGLLFMPKWVASLAASSSGQAVRVSCPLAHPVDYAYLIAVFLMIAYVVWPLCKGTGRKACLAVCSVVFLATLIGSASRGAVVLLVLGVAMVTYRRLRRGQLLLVIRLLLIVAIVFCLSFGAAVAQYGSGQLIGVVERYAEGDDWVTGSRRTEIQYEYLRAAMSQPLVLLFGSRPASIAPILDATDYGVILGETAMVGDDTVYTDPHSSFVWALASLGLVPAAILVVYLLPLRRLLESVKSVDSAIGAIAIGVLLLGLANNAGSMLALEPGFMTCQLFLSGMFRLGWTRRPLCSRQPMNASGERPIDQTHRVGSTARGHRGDRFPE